MSGHFGMKLLFLIVLIADVVVAQSLPPVTKQTPRPVQSIPAIAKAANGAIVTILTAIDDKPIAQGTGFLVSSDGVVVTNYHVIETGNVAVVKFPDGTVFSVDGVLASDKVRDLAIIKIHGKTFRTLALGNSDQIQVGEEVVAIGDPLFLTSTVSNGIVSGMRIDNDRGGKFLQTTAPISPGSSGGPLFDMAGDVVGINTMYLEGGENLNFAIPSNDVKRLLLTRSTKLQDLPNEAEPEETPTQSSEPPKPGAQWLVVKDTTLWSSVDRDGGYGEVISLHIGDKLEYVDSPLNGYRRVFVPTGGYHGYVYYDAVSNDEDVKRQVEYKVSHPPIKFNADTRKFYCSKTDEVVGYLIFVPAGETAKANSGDDFRGPLYLAMSDKKSIPYNAISGEDHAIKAGLDWFKELCQ